MAGGLSILIADDDEVICDVLSDITSAMGHTVDRAFTASETVAKVRQGTFDVVLLDLRFPDCDDLSTLARIREVSPPTDVVMVTAETDDLDIVSEAVKLGAFDYVPKPIRESDIRIRLTRLAQMRTLAHSHAMAVRELSRGHEPRDILGKSPAIREVVRQATEIAAYDIAVLVTGETGTGKELVARAIHFGGPRREKPFVSLNCAAIPGDLIESELFGHVRGAFTSAYASRDGAFREAKEGTLFLDEIGDMDLTSQASLLRVVENGEFRPVGGKLMRSSARLVIATNQDLERLVCENRFRRDLFYRVNRARIDIPPLRGRREDIAILVNHFLRLVDRKIGKGVTRVAPEAMRALETYDWPGNVRELRNELERACIRTMGNEITWLDLSAQVTAAGLQGDREEADPDSLEDAQKLIEALKISAGNVSRAATILGLHRNTVHRWIKRFGLSRR